MAPTFGASTTQQQRENARLERERERLEKERLEREEQNQLTEEQREEIKEAVRSFPGPFFDWNICIQTDSMRQKRKGSKGEEANAAVMLTYNSSTSST